MSHYLIQQALFDAKTVSELDRLAGEKGNISPFELMRRAGDGVFAELLDNFGTPDCIHVFCGAGNNGGDGYIIASLAAYEKISVQIYELGNPTRMSDESKRARQQCIDAKVSCAPFDASCILSEGVIVDCLIGTGFQGTLSDEFAVAIECINSSLLPVIAVDIPSGLASDTGAVQDIAVKADLTVTFVAPKQGLFTGRAPALCGDIVYDSLEIPTGILSQREPSAELMSVDDLLEYFPETEADVHKNQRGHCMVIGGDYGAGGASLLAAQACLHVGAGLTSHATKPEHVSASLVRQPEIMACGVVSGQELEPLLDRPTVLVMGPGLGRSSWSEQMLQKAMSMNVPMVVDADALNIIADGRVVTDVLNRSWVMTPHPGEAARLLGASVAEVEADRFTAVRTLQQKYNAVILLKGAGTLICGDQSRPIQVCPYGNSAMATAGMGDILSGVIGALIAQGMDLQTATELGCCIHSKAADMAVDELGHRGLVASDLLAFFRSILNQSTFLSE
tara:strand:+ start:5185 stop:6705 length:1521 start_codon:yes stop_codon:yes gene_type:complete